MRGYYSRLCSLDWNLPVLKELTFTEQDIPSRFPQISAIRLQIGEDWNSGHAMDETEMQEKLMALVALSPSVQTLTVTPKWRTAAVRAILQNQLEGKLADLDRLVISTGWNVVLEKIDVRDLGHILGLIEAQVPKV